MKWQRTRRDVFEGLDPLEPRLLLDAVVPAEPVRLPADWTVMVYLAADNNLEDAGIDDVNEMEVVGSTASVNILVQLDRTSGYDSSNGNWTDTRRGLVVQDSNASTISTPLTSIGEANMGSPATLTSFIQWGASTYPADRYALVLWDHGGGTSGVCWDDTDSDNLTVSEVGQALTSSGVQMDIIGFDACLMGMLEQAYEVHSQGSVMVGSEQLEPWDGWPFDTFLADLVAAPGQDAATLASGIVTRYGQSYGGQETLSAVDLTAVGALAAELDSFAGTVITEDTDWGSMGLARAAANYYYDTDYRDFGAFIDGVVSSAANANIVAAAQAVQVSYASTVISSHSGPGEGATGLSIYLPAQGGSVSGSYTAANFDLLADTQWDEFLQAFTGSTGGGGTDSDGSIPDAAPAGPLPAAIVGHVGLDGAEDVGGKDVDFYSLSVVAGQQIGFDIDAEETGGSLDSVLRLFDSNGVELDMNDDAHDPDTNQESYDSYIEYTFTKTETVYIAVSGYANWSYDPWTTGSGTSGSVGSYDLLVRNLSGSATDLNGTIPSATVLGAAPGSYSGAIGDEAIGDKDVDFYAISVESNQRLTIGASAGGSGLDAYLKLFAGDGTLLAFDDNTNGVDPEIDYDFSTSGAGTYYVAVSGVPNTNYDPFVLGIAVSGSTGSYTLDLTGYSVHLDFDGVIPRANSIGTLPANVTGSIGDEPIGSLDVDFYAVVAAAGQTLGFDVDAEELGYGFDAELRLFNQSGNELASSDNGTDPDSGLPGNDPYIEYSFAIGDTYYVAVSGAPNDGYFPFAEASGVPGDQGDYELHVRHIGAGNDLNGTIPTAIPVGALPATMVGSIGDEAAGAMDVDFYAVDALAGQSLGFDIDAEDSGSSLDSMLRLFDASGAQLAINDDATDPDSDEWSFDSYLTCEFNANGTYYVAVSGYSNDGYDPFVELSGAPGSTGDYDLLVREIDTDPSGQVGPDAFGYIAYPVTPAFEDIGATGAAGLTPYVDDDYFQLTAADLGGFDFDFYGTAYQELYVSSNGLVTFGSGTDAYDNTNLTTSPSQACIAPYWDDLVIGDSPAAAVLWEVRGFGDQQRLILQWNDVRYIAGADQGQITFQAVLDETDHSMQFNFLDLASSSSHAEGASATVGIKDAGSQSVGGNVLQISVDDGPNNFVGTGRSTRIEPPQLEQWVPYVPSAQETEVSVSTEGGFTTSQVVLTFPDAGFRVSAWGNVVQEGNTFSADAQVERWTGASALVITSFSHDYDLGSLNSGNYSFTFKVSGQVVESESFTIGGLRPDLYGSWLIDPDPPISPATVRPGDQVNVQWTVANNSTIGIPEDPPPQAFGPAYGPWNDAVFLSADRTWDANDVLLGTATFNGTIQPGGSHDFSENFQVPTDTQTGAYNLIAYSDYLATASAGVIDESNEGNNSHALLGQLVVEDDGPAIDVELVVVASPNASDTAAALPSSVATVDVGDTFTVEIWAKNVDGSPNGITGGYLDFLFDTSLVTGGTVSHGALYTNLTDGTVTAGLVDDLGGNAGPGVTDMGDDEWVRLGYVSFTADSEGTADFASAPGVDVFARAGEGRVDWSDVELNTPGPRSVLIEPACPVDIDGDGFIGTGDYSYLSAAWHSSPGDPNWNADADIDGSGYVGTGDYSWLSVNWHKYVDDPTFQCPSARVAWGISSAAGDSSDAGVLNTEPADAGASLLSAAYPQAMIDGLDESQVSTVSFGGKSELVSLFDGTTALGADFGVYVPVSSSTLATTSPRVSLVTAGTAGESSNPEFLVFDADGLLDTGIEEPLLGLRL